MITGTPIMLISRSPAAFLERAGIRQTLRGPASRLRDDYKSRQRPVTFPLPRTDLTLAESGAPAPDRVKTRTWPHGD